MSEGFLSTRAQPFNSFHWLDNQYQGIFQTIPCSFSPTKLYMPPTLMTVHSVDKPGEGKSVELKSLQHTNISAKHFCLLGLN